MSYGPFHTSLTTIMDAVTIDADKESDIVDVRECTDYSIQAVWTDGSTPVGVYSVQAANDINGTFTEITHTALSSDSGSIMVNASNFGYAYVKAKYTFTSGSATMTITVNKEKK